MRWIGIVITVPLLSISLAFGGERLYDEEMVLDQLRKSSQPLSEALRQSPLPAAYKKAIKILESDDPDRLTKAVGTVNKALDKFLTNEDKVLRRLWDGVETFERVTGNVRSRLARSLDKRAGKAGISETAKTRLGQIAKMIRAEKDKNRQRRLKLLFRTTYQLATLKAALPNLSPAQQKLYANSLRVLTTVETKYHDLVYAAHTAYASLRAQREFLGEYEAFGKDLKKLRELVKWAAGKDGSQGSWAKLAENLNGLGQSLNTFTDALAESQEDLIKNLEESVQDGVESIETPGATDDKDLEKLIDEFAGGKKPAGEKKIEKGTSGGGK
jgi:hypothetical protein